MGHGAEGSSAEGGVGAGSGGGEVPEAPGHAHGPREQAGRRETASKPCPPRTGTVRVKGPPGSPVDNGRAGD